MLNKLKYLHILLFCAVLLYSSCSTKKNSLINRAYHNTTARYNGYFNAQLTVKEGADQLAGLHEDKYDRILSIFRYADAQKAKAVFPLMDEAIKKSSLVIQRHSMFIKNKEYCKWIDDNYLLIGKAQFYKHDYFAALETFQYVVSQYKKEPIRYEALVWIMQSYIELGNLLEAENIFDFIKNDEKFPLDLKGEFSAVAADFFIQKRNYSQAIEHLSKAAVLTKKKIIKSRYIFILAQLHQKTGDYKKAFSLYEEVIKLNPPYEMAFNAKINKALSFEVEGGDSRALKKELQKMLKDDKNIEYFDQIYYALAELALKEQDVNSAIQYFKLSTSTSLSNTSQKALSFLELSKIYFDRREYKSAETYYDSTVAFLSKEHPDYSNILNKRNTLSTLVKNLNTIYLEDSLQKLALLTPQQRDKIIDEIIAKEIEEQERKKREEEERKLQNVLISQNQNTNNTNLAGASTWYFYNPTALSLGYSEFIKKWGNRALEDNWRRSNKETVLETFNNAEDSTGLEQDPEGNYVVKDRKKYYKDIPLTEKQLEESNQRIVDAYYSLGIIYKEQLLDNKEAIKNFEELLKRYPDNKYKLPVYYHLYRINLEVNKAKAEYYKNILLKDYPESEYSKIIQNPSYIKESEISIKKLHSFYEETYLAYNNKQYQVVIQRKTVADSLFPSNALKPKFDYLKALSIGKTQGLEAYEKELNDIVIKYPNDPVKAEAVDILTYILKVKNAKSDTAKISDKIIEKSIYTLTSDTSHYYVIAFPNKSTDVNKLKIKLSEYNNKFYSNSTLTINNMFLNPTTQIILVKDFPGEKKAIVYYNGIKNEKVILSNLTGDYKQFIISVNNFATLQKEKELDKYLIFFEQNYPK